MTSPAVNNAFYRLKVEDALSYLDQVKLQFAKQPDVYNQFLDIMKEFKSQSIDTPGVISRVSNLFKGHTDLIEGFNTFLPPGYKIEVQANDHVHVTAPNSTTSTNISQPSSNVNNVPLPPTTTTTSSSTTVTRVQPSSTINLSQPTTASASTVVNIGATNIHLTNTKIEQPNITSILNGNLPASSSINIPSTTTKLYHSQPPPATTPPTAQIIVPHGVTLATTATAASTPASLYASTIQQAAAASVATNTAASAISSSSTSIVGQQNPVEFGHAINYVNKIKNRFQNQPDIYKAFLEILHTYQKQQRSLKDGVFTGQALSETEVYAKVAKLFKNQEDLLHEFSQFLPDANAGASTTAVAAATTAASSSTTNEIKIITDNNQQSTNTINQSIPQSTSTASSSSSSSTTTQSLAKSLLSNQINTPPSTTTTSKTSRYSQKQAKQQQQQQANQENSNKLSIINNNTPQIQSSTTTTKSNANTPMSHSTNHLNHHHHHHLTTSSTTVTPSNSAPIKRASSNHQVSAKKQKLSTPKVSNSNTTNTIQQTSNNNQLSNALNNANFHMIPINDSDYVNSLNEITFFDHVKKALRSTDVYKNFLRCIALFNQEIINRQELIKIVEPYLGKFPELYRWFKNYVDDKDERMIQHNKNQLQKERIDLPHGDNLMLEIDYSACKQYGASYREICSYPQPVCSARTELCKEVLNDTFVSFPCWSEDSTFVTSKKNQYEELLFRTEDERFELDVILETNQSTIRVLEGVQKKMLKMSSDELSKFRLDNCLGGTSEIIHFKAIQRIYGDKAKDFIEGTKRNPAVAVPLILKRLKAKDDEWREAKKNFEKIWREQIEKNYLKSLDYCAVPFKQSDQKHLKTRSLLNEIETIYFERQEAKEEGQDVPQTPHLTFKYDDKSILEDAAALIIHHVKRQMGIQKEDKQKIKQIVYHFLPDLFFVPRGALSDDEADDEDDDSNTSNNNNNNNNNKKKEKKPARHTDTNKRRLTDIDDRPRDVPEEYKSPEDMYRLFFVDDHWYLFFRYHHILCERLYKIYKHSINFAEQESIDAKNRQKSVADALKLRNKCKNTAASEYYPAFLDIVRNLLDGNIDGSQYEDTLREMFGIHAYIAFTLDKVVQNCVRQLQYLVQEETCVTLRHYYLDEQKTSATGCKVVNMQSTNTQNLEIIYQKKVESLLQDQNCFKIIMYKNSGRLTFELLDTESQENQNEMNEIEKWSEYIEKYCGDEANQITDEIKESLLTKPVFLTRNAHWLKQKLADDDKKQDNTLFVDNTICKFDVNSYKRHFEPNTGLTFYRKYSLRNARKSHQSVTKGMYDSFKKYLNKWLKEKSTPTDSISDWLFGHNINNNTKTTSSKEATLKKTPYHVYYKYKTATLNNNDNNNNNNNNNSSTQQQSITTTKSKDKSKTTSESNSTTTTTTLPPPSPPPPTIQTVKNEPDSIKIEPVQETVQQTDCAK